MSEDLVRQQAEALTLALRQLMRRLSALSPEDPTARLTLAQLRVCTLLSEGSLPMSAISRELGISLSAVTQIADRLERAGLVHRVAQKEDRRVRILQMTPRAIRMMRRREEKRVQSALRVLETLPAEERESVVEALQRLLKASRDTTREGPDSLPLVGETNSTETP